MTPPAVSPRRTAAGDDTPADGPLRWRDDRAGVLLAALATTVFLAVSLLRWRNHWAGALDLGVFDQGVWKLSRFRSPELSLLPDNLFGDHLSLVLLLYVPLYWVHASPAWMLVSQAVAVGLTVLPMRALARQLHAPPALAAVAVMSSAPLIMAVLFDFHPVVLTVPLVTWALVSGLRDDVRTTVLLAVAIAFMRADAGVLVLGVAVVATPRVRRAIVPVALASMALGALVPALLHSEQTFPRYYGSLGEGPLDALTHPWRIATTLVGSRARQTMLLWLLPVGFLPLLRPRWFLALVVGGLPLVLSTFVNTSVPWFHHAGTVAPFAIAGALAAVGRYRTHPAPPSLLLTGLVLALFLQGPLIGSGPESQRWTALRPRSMPGLDAALARVRPHDAVAADSTIALELARRDGVYLLCRDEDDCDLPGAPGEVVDVVIARRRDAATLERAGWVVEPVDVAGSDLIVARPPKRGDG